MRSMGHQTRHRRVLAGAAIFATACAVAGCGASGYQPHRAAAVSSITDPVTSTPAGVRPTVSDTMPDKSGAGDTEAGGWAAAARINPALANHLPGMPPPLAPENIYAADAANDLAPAVRAFQHLIYVPNSESSSVDVIDPATGKIIHHYPVGRNPQHVVPSYDLKTLFVLNDQSNSVTEIDPATGRLGKTIPVTDPYNMYFTPDGNYAIVVEEARQTLAFRDPHTMALRETVPVDCQGIDHLDFSANGRYLLASCEFSGKMMKLDVAAHKVDGYLALGPHASPQDVRVSPDGRVFYVADRYKAGVWLIDGDALKIVGFLPTAPDAHGLYLGRDSYELYVTNRNSSSISVIDTQTRKVTATWLLPHASPDMGGISVDGNTLWFSGRYSGEVYKIDAHTGKLLSRIPVGLSPHGLCVYPQPGRYSLGHTGVFR